MKLIKLRQTKPIFHITLSQEVRPSPKLCKGVFTWIRIEFQSGSNSFRFCWDHRGLSYICLQESGLSCNSFRIEFIPFFIPDWTLDPEWNVDSESCKLGSKFHSWIKLGMESTFIMAEIKIVCEMGSFIHEFHWNEFQSGMRFSFAVIFRSSTQ